MNVPVLRAIKVRRKIRVPKKKSRFQRTPEKTMSWDPFFNDEDVVNSIKKASNRLRPCWTLCMMPKYVDAIEGRLKLCSAKKRRESYVMNRL